MSLSEYEVVLKPDAAEKGAQGNQDGSEEQSDALIVELVDVTETETRWGDISTSVRTADRQKGRDLDRFANYAVVLRRRMNHQEEPKSTHLEIRSPIIRAALKIICADNPYTNINSDPIIISKPYVPLFHYRQEIRDYANDKVRTEQEKKHMQILLSFMDKHLGKTVEEYDRLLPAGMVSFGILWTLFRPEAIVVAQRDHYIQCFVTESFDVTMVDGNPALYVIVRSWDYNGSRFGPLKTSRIIRHFNGLQKISALEIYPIEFHKEPDGSDLREKLIARGQKWRQLVDVSHRMYNGICWTDPSLQAARSIEELIPMHTVGRIILDYATHQQANPQLSTILSESSVTAVHDPNRPPPPPGNSSYRPEGMTQSDVNEDRYLSHLNEPSYVMSDDQALLCPPRIRGFSLTDKTWAFFLVEKITEIVWQENTMDRLEIEPKEKQVIQALVNSHGRKKRRINGEFDDIIAGKGQGLVFLLSGPPGLGKTLTVESIAEHQKLPMYAITSGELGTDVIQTDLTLRKIFTRAKAWSAVLLLDEADVFLAKRDRTDLQRNAFVSIFLRLIEYYQGILFLTTNRLQEFDEAFESRIHLRLNYKPLDSVRRTTIWKHLLEPLPGTSWELATLQRLGNTYRLNGRAIKNLIKAALALAEDRDEALSEAHLSTVYQLNTSSTGWTDAD